MIEFGNTNHGIMLARATNAVFNPYGETVISRSENGELLGGVIFSLYTGSSVCVDVASMKPNWVNRELLYTTFNYIFNQLLCKVALGRVATNNKQALRFDTHIGFEIVAVIKDAVPDGDVAILALRKENCKWLKLKPKNMVVLNYNTTSAA